MSVSLSTAYSVDTALTDSPTNTIRAWLGGSFDPVHFGHVMMLTHVYQSLHSAFPDYAIIASFLPTAGSPLKDRPTPQHDRFAMLSLALQEAPYLSVDNSELQRSAPVYTFDTLTAFQTRYPNDIRIFIMGADSVLSLDKWYRGFELIKLANLWIIPRPSIMPAAVTSQASPSLLLDSLDPTLKKYVTFNLEDLINQQVNLIYIDVTPPPPLASRDIRAWLHEQEGSNAQAIKAALPEGVRHYIMTHGLYQSDITQ